MDFCYIVHTRVHIDHRSNMSIRCNLLFPRNSPYHLWRGSHSIIYNAYDHEIISQINACHACTSPAGNAPQVINRCACRIWQKFLTTIAQPICKKFLSYSTSTAIYNLWGIASWRCACMTWSWDVHAWHALRNFCHIFLSAFSQLGVWIKITQL
jgi:hypothetical protein